MILEGTSMSCGVQQIDGLFNKPKNNLERIAKKMFGTPYAEGVAFVQWSDVFGRNEKGNRLYHYIKRKFPKSSIQRTKTAKNPNSGNRICIYTWKIPRNFKTWYKKVILKTNGSCSRNKFDLDWCKKHDCYPEDC